jgi:hypothetical protein
VDARTPRRRLARVTVTGVDPSVLQPGWRSGEGRELVEVTAVDPAGQGAALAFVPGTAGAGQVLGDAPAVVVEVIALIGDAQAPPGHDPAMRRRRDRSGADGPPRRAV